MKTTNHSSAAENIETNNDCSRMPCITCVDLSGEPNRVWLRKLSLHCYQFCFSSQKSESLEHRLNLLCPQCGGKMEPVMISGEEASLQLFVCDQCIQKLYLS